MIILFLESANSSIFLLSCKASNCCTRQTHKIHRLDSHRVEQKHLWESDFSCIYSWFLFLPVVPVPFVFDVTVNPGPGNMCSSSQSQDCVCSPMCLELKSAFKKYLGTSVSENSAVIQEWSVTGDVPAKTCC